MAEEPGYGGERPSGGECREDGPQRASHGVPAPRYAPEPEGPEEIAEKVGRAREGLPTAARRRLARSLGLGRLSPVRQVLTLFAAAVEISLLGPGFFTDLPTSWLLTTAFLVLPFLLHYFERRDTKDADRAAGGIAYRSGRGLRT